MLSLSTKHSRLSQTKYSAKVYPSAQTLTDPMRVGQAHMAYTLVNRQGFVPYESLWELGFLGGEYVAEPRYLAQ